MSGTIRFLKKMIFVGVLLAQLAYFQMAFYS